MLVIWRKAHTSSSPAACLPVRAQSEEDLYALRSSVAQLEDAVMRTTQQLAATQRAAGDDKLAMFRQQVRRRGGGTRRGTAWGGASPSPPFSPLQSALIAKKLAQKEEALDVASRESEALGRELESRVRQRRWGQEEPLARGPPQSTTARIHSIMRTPGSRRCLHARSPPHRPTAGGQALGDVRPQVHEEG